MASSTSPSRDSYAPTVSSPLNPRRESSPTSPPCCPRTSPTLKPSKVQRSRRNSRESQCSLSSSSSSSSSSLHSVSPAQKLLRQKGAEAWRSQRLSRRVAEYEVRAVKAISSRRAAEVKSRISVENFARSLKKNPEQQQYSLGSRTEPTKEHGEDQPYLFHMPEISFFTPTKVVMEMGMMRATGLSSIRQQNVSVSVL